MKMLMIDVLFNILLDCDVVKDERNSYFDLRIPRGGDLRIATFLGYSAQHLDYKSGTKLKLLIKSLEW